MVQFADIRLSRGAIVVMVAVATWNFLINSNLTITLITHIDSIPIYTCIPFFHIFLPTVSNTNPIPKLMHSFINIPYFLNKFIHLLIFSLVSNGCSLQLYSPGDKGFVSITFGWLSLASLRGTVIPEILTQHMHAS